MTRTFLQILLLLVATNGAPVLAAYFMGRRGDLPVDFGKRLGDGRALFGSSKTWRGLLAATLAACLLSMLLGYSPLFGLTFGALAMAGDLLSSFVKRRSGLEPSDQSLGWDQLPESLLPSLYAVAVLDLPWWHAVLLPIAFMLVEILISKPLFKLHIRKRPY
jgi:CDP-2,3-bis-(O-geranylgeranyl)-sn-glycerol synthase